MKSVLLTIITIFSLVASAHQFHTPNYCHANVENFCAHIGYSEQPQVNEAFEFVVDFVTTPEMLNKISTANVQLWMPSMGHGSAPVKIERLDLNHFQVSEAYFVMAGTWSVKIEAVTAEGNLTLDIPFEIK
jgi:hypothetical protein